MAKIAAIWAYIVCLFFMIIKLRTCGHKIMNQIKNPVRLDWIYLPLIAKMFVFKARYTLSNYLHAICLKQFLLHATLLLKQLKQETETQMVWPHLKILWHGEDNSARDSERSKKERKTEEEMGR